MHPRKICILGGTGFVGRHLVARLARDGHQVRVPTRRRERHKNLIVIPQVTLVEADILGAATLVEQFRDCDTIINLVGILNQPRRSNLFEKMHVELPRRVVETAQYHGIRRLLHMSALNANPEEPNSIYLRTKGIGEDLVHGAAGLQVTSFRPSVIFGEDDSFFNRFAGLLRLAPGIFPLACPDAHFAPVFVGDVVDAFAAALGDKRSIGKRYDLCGPEEYSLKELVEFTARTAGTRRYILGLGRRASRLQALILGLVPGQPFTLDNYYSLQIDSVCRHSQLAGMGIEPTAVGAVVPAYLGKGTARQFYGEWRRRARRSSP